MEIHLQIKLNRPHIRMQRRFVAFEALVLTLVLLLTGAVSHLRADTGTCGGAMITLPFTDILNGPSSGFFCFIAQIYFQGITVGTSATTYSPDNPVTRGQMAVFLARTEDLALKRGSRRTAIGKQWSVRVPYSQFVEGRITQSAVQFAASDGISIYYANQTDGVVSRTNIHASSPQEQGNTWTGAAGAYAILTNGRLAYITGNLSSGKLYIAFLGIGGVYTVPQSVGPFPAGITFDGEFLWIACYGANPGGGAVSKIHPDTDGSGFTIFNGTGFDFSRPYGILFDGENLWVTDDGAAPAENSTLKRVDRDTGQVLQTITVGKGAGMPVFDGTNLWVPNLYDDTISVVRAVGGLRGAILATLTGNGMSRPLAGAFDGERILFTNNGTNGASLWNAASLTPLGSVPVKDGVLRGACSDGLDFYVTNQLTNGFQLLRF